MLWYNARYDGWIPCQDQGTGSRMRVQQIRQFIENLPELLELVLQSADNYISSLL